MRLVNSLVNICQKKRQPVTSLLCIVQVNCVLSVEHFTGRVSRDCHDDAFRYTVLAHVGIECVSQVVEPNSPQASPAQGREEPPLDHVVRVKRLAKSIAEDQVKI